jgi:hypothetical protein
MGIANVIPDWISAIATVIGVVGVLWQLNLLQKQLRLQNYVEYTKRYQAIILNFPETINAPSFSFEHSQRKISGASTELSSHYDNTMRHMRAYFDLCFEEWPYTIDELSMTKRGGSGLAGSGLP